MYEIVDFQHKAGAFKIDAFQDNFYDYKGFEMRMFHYERQPQDFVSYKTAAVQICMRRTNAFL